MTLDLPALARWALSSALLILLVLLLRRTKLAAKLSRTACYALWLPVLLRLLLPMQFITTPFALDPTRQAKPLYTIESTEYITASTAPEDTVPATPAHHPAQTLAPSAPTASNAPRPAEGVLTVWGIGAAMLAVAIAATNLTFIAKLHRRRVPLADASAALPVYTVEGLGSPCLVGVLRPAIYLSPADARDAHRLCHILAHESSHYRGGDHVWSLLRAAALCLHWYAPLVWYAAALSKRDAELACDERTLRSLGGAERTAYGETLLSLTLAKPRARDLLTCSTAMVGSKTTLRARIEGIAHSRQTRAAAAFAAIAILVLALVFAFGKPQETGEYGRFLERVEVAAHIAYHPPAYSSSYYPALIDPDLVAEARALLLELEPASERDVPAGELNIMVASGFSLDEESCYYLLNVDGMTLLYQQKPNTDGVKDDDFTLIGKYTNFLIARRLDTLAGRQRELLSAAGIGDAQGELRSEIFERASVSGSETDFEMVARSIGEQTAAAWLAVSDETVWKPTDAKLASVNVFDIYYGENGEGRNFCANVGWKLKFDSRFSSNYWEAGSGLSEPDTDGYSSFGLDCLFRIGDDGRWHIASYGSGSYSVECGIDLYRDEIIDCAALVKAFCLTVGKTHDYLIPSRFCDLPALERAKLGAVLDGYPDAQASDFLRAISDHLAQYPTYHDLMAETLYTELPDKYKDFTLILAAEPFWTGEIGDGRFALYDYGKAEWALLYETGDARELAATYRRDPSDPNDSIPAFVMDDLLGFPGVAVQSDAVSAHKSHSYYARTDYGVQYVGYSFGFYDTPTECTFSVDFDGDGRSELITNNTYGADGAERVTVFHWNGAAAEVGLPDWSKTGVDLTGIGAMHYQESCDTARGTVTITYTTISGTKSAELPLAPESFRWTELGELY